MRVLFIMISLWYFLHHCYYHRFDKAHTKQERGGKKNVIMPANRRKEKATTNDDDGDDRCTPDRIL